MNKTSLSLEKHLLMMWRIIRSIPHDGLIELFLVPTSALQLVYQKPRYVLSCLCDGSYKKIPWSIVATRFLSCYLSSQCSTTGVRKGCGMCYPVCGMIHIKDSLLLIRKSRPWSGGNGFFVLLSRWSFTLSLMSYNCEYFFFIYSASLNKIFFALLHL